MNFKGALLKPIPTGLPSCVSPSVPALQNKQHVVSSKDFTSRLKNKQVKNHHQYSAMIISPGYGGEYWYEAHTDLAKNLYTQRCQAQNRSEDQDNRYDPIMIGIIQEFDNKQVYYKDQIALVYHDSKYKGFVDVTEYDGFESASINVEAYKLHKVKQIHDYDYLSPGDKVAHIGMVLQDKCKDALIYSSLPREK